MTKQVMKQTGYIYGYIHKVMSEDMCNSTFNSRYNLGVGCQFILETFLYLPYCFSFCCFVFSNHALSSLSDETKS